MDEPILIMSIAGATLFVLAIIKCYILFKAGRRKNLRRWFYFSQREIIEAPTPRAAVLRKAQNTLTVVFFVLAVLAAFLLYLFGK